jgi:outer membrane protein assembly factor BamA
VIDKYPKQVKLVTLFNLKSIFTLYKLHIMSFLKKVTDLKKIAATCLLMLPFVLYAQNDSTKKSRFNNVLLPLITKSIETDWSFGIASVATFKISKTDSISRTSNIEALALYSLKKQFVAAINGTQYFKHEQLILNEQISYSSFPDKFWGIGKNTLATAEESYSFQQYYIYAHLMKNLGNHFFIGALAEFQNVMQVKYEQGGLFDKENIAGRNGYHSAGLGVSFTYDKRNHAFAPEKGLFAQVFFTGYESFFGSDYNFFNAVVDIRKYITTYKKQVLALQLYTLNNIGNDIPIRNLAALGGANTMRGFYSGRYRDNDVLVVQSEYRVPVYGRFGLAAFAGIGGVANNLKDYAINDFKYSFGGGLRIALSKSERLNLRIDYGVAQGGKNGLYFQIGEAF